MKFPMDCFFLGEQSDTAMRRGTGAYPTVNERDTPKMVWEVFVAYFNGKARVKSTVLIEVTYLDMLFTL